MERPRARSSLVLVSTQVLGALRAPVVALLFGSLALAAGCASAKLAPADANQKVPNRPKAAQTESAGIRLQAEADVWVADERVKDEVTAMKVTVTNRSPEAVRLDYFAFSLVAKDGEVFEAVAPEAIKIRGANRSIGLSPDTIITRSSDSSVNAPQRTESEKDQIRTRLIEQALLSGEVASGDRRIGFVYFRRVPSTKSEVALEGRVLDATGDKALLEAKLPFVARAYQ